jgi:hypothetical protein
MMDGSADVLDRGGTLALVGANAIVGIGTVAGESSISAGAGACLAVPGESLDLVDIRSWVGLVAVDLEAESQRGEDEQESNDLHLLVI